MGVLMGGGVLRVGATRPKPEAVEAEVERLGAAKQETRERAQAVLGDWAAQYPRFMLISLARAYRDVEDVEVEFRLREVLKPLALVYRFGGAPGFLGVNLAERELEGGRKAILLQRVHPGLAAEKAGLKQGDLIVSFEGQAIGNLDGAGGFSKAVADTPPGSVVELGVRRGQEEFTTRAVLVLRPLELNGQRILDPAMQEEMSESFEDWLRSLRPHRMENGIPAGHFPAEEDL